MKPLLKHKKLSRTPEKRSHGAATRRPVVYLGMHAPGLHYYLAVQYSGVVDRSK